MKALLKKTNKYGDMELVEIEEPITKDDQIKIKVAFSGICGSDIHSYKGEYNNLRPPVVLGHEFSGIVVQVGKGVKGISIGDKVTSETTFYICEDCDYCINRDYNLCSNRKGLGTQVNGSFAEYVVARKESVHILPDNVDLLSASITEPLACAAHAVLEKTNVELGDIVLVCGPGPIGLLTSQIVKARGGYVILSGLTNDEERLKVADELGIDRTVNIEKEDLGSIVRSLTNGYGADKIFECSGSVKALDTGISLIRKKGEIIQVGIFTKPYNEIGLEEIIQKEICYSGCRSQKPSSWELALYLMQTGKVNTKAIISNVYDLDDWKEAFEKVINGEGLKVVLKP
ncbi:D-arabitol-phosphate dehydrogenase [Tepidanaerobacter acetatoxydans Re1]|uniref:D-arabitol-phosphate dehydrogenase n=1 Tax=Tepidanaerobacter acetatoxydans (strain DSM 21804 / JCM 16047 / Re1) TaxID=1209989 RepID=F4LW32_TEPAE|nr:zinc-binding dehydrogenase [Tepidanaerobacter acetatoxydans]AEE90808.1 L-iditol 2-dehydrogenase [Tepidanaerobacter acetatoxydans Re1]CCP25365.1 D-arabitol-phosphate dehydrogenase [Tepidanaerobacter acetatoxydans Re1]